jgi:hypothetical protein
VLIAEIISRFGRLLPDFARAFTRCARKCPGPRVPKEGGCMVKTVKIYNSLCDQEFAKYVLVFKVGCEDR